MTARRQQPDFGAAAAARRSRTADGTAPEAPTNKKASAGAVTATRKYTLLLDGPGADAFDLRLLTIRRAVGRKVDKSEVIRELLAMLDDDETILGQVAERLRLR